MTTSGFSAMMSSMLGFCQSPTSVILVRYGERVGSVLMMLVPPTILSTAPIAINTSAAFELVTTMRFATPGSVNVWPLESVIVTVFGADGVGDGVVTMLVQPDKPTAVMIIIHKNNVSRLFLTILYTSHKESIRSL